MLSIIIPTKNSANTLEMLLISLKKQIEGGKDEILVIDNFSEDESENICAHYGVKISKQGPERAAQRRKGAKIAINPVLVFLDSDMEVTPGLLDEIKAKIKTHDTLIIPEEPHGASNFWTKAKIIERNWQETQEHALAARVMTKKAYAKAGGWPKDVICGEDWMLTHNLRKTGAKIGKTSAKVRHNEGVVSLKNIWSKKRYYGGHSQAILGAKAGAKPFIFRKSFWMSLPWFARQGSQGFAAIFLLFFSSLAFFVGILDAKRRKR